MAKVYLHGTLKTTFQPSYDLDVSSPAEAIRALCIQVPGFLATLEQYDFQISVGGVNGTDENLLDESTLALVTQRDIHIIPVVQGSKKGVGKIILAAALIAAAFVIPGGQTLAVVAGKELTTTMVSNALLSAGISVGLRGVSMLLSPQQTEGDGNKLFNNDPLTAQLNTPVPLLYGEMLIDLIPISASVTAGLVPSYQFLDGSGITSGTTIDNWNFDLKQIV